MPDSSGGSFSQDSRVLVIRAGQAFVVDAATGDPIREFGPVESMPAVSSDWRWAVTAGGGRIAVFDIATGVARWERPLTPSLILNVAISEDDRRIAVTQNAVHTGRHVDATHVKLFDAVTGDLERSVACEGGLGRLFFITWAAVAQSPDLHRLLATSQWLRLFSTVDGRRLFQIGLAPGQDFGVEALFSPDGGYIAVNAAPGEESANERAVAVLNAETGATVWQDTTDQVLGIAYSPDGALIAAGGKADSGGGFVRVYETGPEVSRHVHAGPVTRVAINTLGMRLAATTSNATASVFHADSGDLMLERPQPGRLTSIRFSPDGQSFVTGGTQGLRLYDTVSGVPVWKLELGVVNNLAIGGDSGEFIAAACEDKTARVVRRVDGEQLWKRMHQSAVSHVVFSSDSQWVATGAGRTTRILDGATGAEHHRIDHDGIVHALAFSPTGPLLAVASQDGVVRMIAAPSGEQRQPIGHPTSVTTLAFSPDGTQLATGGGDRVVRVFGLAEDPPILLDQLTYDAPLTMVRFNPATGQLAIVSENATLRIIDVATGEERRRLRHPAPVRDIAFSRDGELVVTACDDTAARIFRAR
jgi:WD40 repeat protein